MAEERMIRAMRCAMLSFLPVGGGADSYANAGADTGSGSGNAAAKVSGNASADPGANARAPDRFHERVS
jgi:hypothetical protein